MRAGFRCDRRFVNSAGQVTELTFLRHGPLRLFRMSPLTGACATTCTASS